jgi:3-hydroxyisobutyrate dehydrogenase-like beta-hydroxyacid dehydrogenase
MSLTKTVGFIGLGNMGYALARNVLQGGFKLIVHDLHRAAAEPLIGEGAGWANSPRQLSEQCDVVLLSLPMPADVEAVCFGEEGVLAGLRRGRACFDLSTNSLATLQRIHAAATDAGLDFLDSPVSGGAAGAAKRQLVIWVGGAKTVFDAHQDVLLAMGDRVEYLGKLGTATAAKLTINLTAAGISGVIAETFALGVKAGVEPRALWSAMRSSALGRRRTFDFLAKFLSGDFDSGGFALKLAHKDVILASEMARQLKVPLRIADVAVAEMTEAVGRGWGGRDSSVSMTLQKERVGVDVFIDAEAIKSELKT